MAEYAQSAPPAPPHPDQMTTVAGQGESALSPDGKSQEGRLSRDLYEHYSASQSEWAEEAGEDLEFYQGVHWTDKQKADLLERGQNPISIQTTYQLVEQAVAMLTTRNPAFRATAREDGDQAYAGVVSDLLQWIWQQSDGQHQLKTSVRDYYVQSRGVLYPYVDPNKDHGKGDVCITTLDPKDVFPDPNAKDPLWDDAAHVLVRRVLTAEQITKRWPEAPLEKAKESEEYAYGPSSSYRSNSEQLFPQSVSDQAHKRYEVIERFTKVERPAWRVEEPGTTGDLIFSEEEYQEYRERPAYVVQTQQSEEVITDPGEVARLDALYDEVGPVFHERRSEPMIMDGGAQVQMPPQIEPGPLTGAPGEIPGSETRLHPATAGALIEAGYIDSFRFLRTRVRVVATVDGFNLYEPFDLPTKHYPVIPISNGHNRNPYTISDVRRVKDLQKAINKTNSLILAHAANVTNQKVFYPEGSIQDVSYYEQEWGKAGTAFLPYQPEYGNTGGIQVPNMQQLPAELYANMDRFMSLMERILGIFSLQQGDPSNSPATFKGTVAIDEFGMRRIKSKMDDIYRSIARCGQVSLDYAQALYTGRKVIRLTQPNGQTIEARLGIEEPQGQQEEQAAMLEKWADITSGRYDVIVMTGSTLPSNRWALLEQYQEMFDRGIVDDIAVLKKTELPDADEILERKALYKEMQSVIQQQEEAIKNMKGDLQTLQRQTMNAEKRAELEKFKARLDNYEGEIKNAGQVFETSLRKEQEKQQALLAQERSLRSQKMRQSN